MNAIFWYLIAKSQYFGKLPNSVNHYFPNEEGIGMMFQNCI